MASGCSSPCSVPATLAVNPLQEGEVHVQSDAERRASSLGNHVKRKRELLPKGQLLQGTHHLSPTSWPRQPFQVPTGCTSRAAPT